MLTLVARFAPLLLGAVVAAQDVASIDGLIEGLRGRDVAVRVLLALAALLGTLPR